MANSRAHGFEVYPCNYGAQREGSPPFVQLSSSPSALTVPSSRIFSASRHEHRTSHVGARKNQSLLAYYVADSLARNGWWSQAIRQVASAGTEFVRDRELYKSCARRFGPSRAYKSIKHRKERAGGLLSDAVRLKQWGVNRTPKGQSQRDCATPQTGA
jgi:hypothetical protein